MNKHAAFIADALAWEARNGWGPTTPLQESRTPRHAVHIAGVGDVQLKDGRIIVERTEAAERVLQESLREVRELHEQLPTSAGKSEPPKPAAVLDGYIHQRLAAALLGGPKFMTLQEEAAAYHAAPPKRKPVTLAESRITETQLEEARVRLYAAGRGDTVTPLPDGIHERLARALRS